MGVCVCFSHRLIWINAQKHYTIIDRFIYFCCPVRVPSQRTKVPRYRCMVTRGSGRQKWTVKEFHYCAAAAAGSAWFNFRPVSFFPSFCWVSLERLWAPSGRQTENKNKKHTHSTEDAASGFRLIKRAIGRRPTFSRKFQGKNSPRTGLWSAASEPSTTYLCLRSWVSVARSKVGAMVGIRVYVAFPPFGWKLVLAWSPGKPQSIKRPRMIRHDSVRNLSICHKTAAPPVKGNIFLCQSTSILLAMWTHTHTHGKGCLYKVVRWAL